MHYEVEKVKILGSDFQRFVFINSIHAMGLRGLLQSHLFPNNPGQMSFLRQIFCYVFNPTSVFRVRCLYSFSCNGLNKKKI